MPELQLKIGQLEINPDQPKDWLVKVFIAKSSPAKEKTLGKIFGLLEARFSKQLDENFLDDLIKKIKINYYKLSDGVEETSIENIFEQALKKTNEEIKELIKKESGFDIKNFNAIIAVLKDQQLYFAPVGSAHIFLIHHLSGNNYKIIDILETTRNIDAYPSVTKIFSNVVSGEIKEKDCLLLANGNFLDYLSLDKIKKIITDLPAGSAAEQFKSLLLGVNNHNSFGALVIKLSPVIAKIKAPIFKPVNDNSPQDSMEELIDTEVTTEKLLNPSLGLNFGQYLKKILAIFPSGKIAKTAYNKGSYGRSQNLLNNLLKKTGKFLMMLGYLLKGLFNLMSRPHSQSDKSNLLIKKIDDWLGKFGSLPRFNKLILIAALIFIIIFAQSIVILSKRQSNKVEQNQYEQLVSQVYEKQDSAEASLIYKDEERARQLLLAARELIGALPQNSRQRRKEFLTLTDKNERLLEKTKKIIKVDNPAVIADFAETKINFPYPKQIILANNLIYSYNPADNSIYRLNLDSKEIKNLNAITSQVGHLQIGITLDDGSLLFYHDNDGLAKFNPQDNTISPIAIEFGGPTKAKVSDLLVYNKRLYLLDTANNQIYKHEAIAGGFAKGNAWLTGQVDLNNAVSLAVNGYIYVLKNNGEIYRFLKGQKQDLTLNTLETPFNQPIKIWTDIDSDYLYILDPSNKRLVVLTKEGVLQAQYASEKFNNLKDFAVKEKENKIYLLNGSQIIEVPIQHKG